MNSEKTILIAIAETSVIVRNGLVSVLKRLSDINIDTIEITSKEGLLHCLEAHSPQILIINPQFEGWFDITNFKNNYPQLDIKIMALLCTFVDATQLKDYDGNINLFDTMDILEQKIASLMNFTEEYIDQETLIKREKEIIG